jgi:hypothetical protein
MAWFQRSCSLIVSVSLLPDPHYEYPAGAGSHVRATV